MSPNPDFFSLCPLDGRYRSQTLSLRDYFCEAALNRARLLVEIDWLNFLTQKRFLGLSPLEGSTLDSLKSWARGLGKSELTRLKAIEARTRHDVKAVEYFLRQKLEESHLGHLVEAVHFGCTSEDINNLAYALNTRDALRSVWLPSLAEVINRLVEMARHQSATSMLSRTHGQPATPTTLGKEAAVAAHRLIRQKNRIEEVEFLGKFSGATGVFSAHYLADDRIDWLEWAREFVEGLGLEFNPLTTQIESHDAAVELFLRLNHANRILHNLSTDLWSYISLGYFLQKPSPGTVGSSTMPHKINPIRFENAEANLELSSALFECLARELSTSRLQRDLSDSSLQRNIGSAFGYGLIALDNLAKGLDSLEVNHKKLARDLDSAWPVLAEAIQTVIRAEVLAGRSRILDPYALLKELTQGAELDAEALKVFIDRLEVSAEARARLRRLTPANYVGLAKRLTGALQWP